MKSEPNGRLSQEFWTLLYQSFGLSNIYEEDMEPPDDDDEEGCVELYDTLKIALHKNPALRKIKPFQSYMAHATSLDRSSAYGMFMMTLEGPRLTRENAVRMQIAILEFLARTCF